MTQFDVYLWLMLDTFKQIWILPFVLGFLICICLISHKDDRDCKIFFKWVRRIVIPMWILAFIIATLTFFVPSSKKFAVIMVLPNIVNSETVKDMQDDMPEMYSVAKDYLKELMSTESSGEDKK